AIAISDKTAFEPADIEERIPVSAVPREACDFGRENDADLFQCNFGEEFFEAFTMLGGSCRQAQIGIDDLDLVLMPTETESALFEGILQTKALLIGQDLMRRRLPNVDDRLTSEMLCGDQF